VFVVVVRNARASRMMNVVAMLVGFVSMNMLEVTNYGGYLM
jgi:hypothetical protein